MSRENQDKASAKMSLSKAIRDPRRRNFLVLNGVGGICVLGTYVWGAVSASAVMGSLWGGVPEAIRPLYTINMLLSAAGYFLFAPYILLRVDTSRSDIAGPFSYSLFGVLMFLILIPSACWLPLTATMLADPSVGLWWLIRIDLGLVALGSLGLLLSLSMLRPPRPAGRVAAIVGLIPFCLQTVVLDALVWPVYFGS